MIFDISEKDIVNLNEHEFVDLLNRLIKQESKKIKIPAINIETTLSINSPDGGIDAKVNNEKKDTDRIPKGISIWQYKKGPISNADLKKELIKEDVYEARKAGASYILVNGVSLSQTQRKNKFSTIEKNKPNPNSKTHILSAQDVADWTNEYPSLKLLSYFKKPFYDDVLVFDEWMRRPELRINKVGFEIDSYREEIIKNISEKANLDHGSYLRISGKSGIGKTRLVFEAIKENNLCDRVIYIASYDSLPPDFFSSLSIENSNSIIIIDECSANNAAQIIQKTSKCHNVLLITIGHDPKIEASKYQTDYFELHPLEISNLKNIVKSINQNLPDHVVNYILQVSSGYVKLLIMLTEEISQIPDISNTSQLLQVDDIAQLLDNFIPDKTNREVMMMMSLLTRVGMEEEFSIEGERLAKFISLDFKQFKLTVEKMRKEGFISKKGRFMYVTPQLLALWLASEAWKTWGEQIRNEIINNPKDLPNSELLESLFKRLAELGEEDFSSEIVHNLIFENGLFPNIDSLDNPFTAKLFSMLGEISPRYALNRLTQIIENADRNRLLSFSSGRREIIWFLEKLLKNESTFWDSAKIIFILAQSENEKISNNATGVWCEIFLTHLSGLPIPAKDRYKLIEKVLDSSDISSRILGLKGISYALLGGETKLVTQNLPNIIKSEEWAPQRWEELWEARKSALLLLDKAITDEDEKIRNDAKKILIHSIHHLIAEGLFNDIYYRLEKLNIQDYSLRRQEWEEINRVLLDSKILLKKDQKEKMNILSQFLIGDSYLDKLKRWVGNLSFIDYRNLKNPEIEQQNNIEDLVNKGYTNSSLSKVEFEWLASDEAYNSNIFMKKLGEIDNQNAYFDLLIDNFNECHNPSLVSYYLLGKKSNNEMLWVDAQISSWIETDPEKALIIFDYQYIKGGSHEGLERILKIYSKGWIKLNLLGRLGYGSWVKNLDISDIRLLLSQYIEAINNNEQIFVENPLLILYSWLQNHKKDALEMKDYASIFLIQPWSKDSSVMTGYYWENLAITYSVVLSKELTTAILEVFKKSEFIPSEDPRINLLRTLLLNNPEEVWPKIGDLALNQDFGYKVRIHLQNWGIEQAGTKTLLDWAKLKGEKALCILAEMSIPLSDLSRELLINFKEHSCIKKSLMANFISGSYVGPTSVWLEGKLTIVEEWTKDDQEEIRNWANELKTFLLKEIRAAKKQEEEGF